jgi:hypothetical protein
MSFQRAGAGPAASVISDGASLEGSLTGATGSRILMPNGTAALPPYGFSGDLDTGIYYATGGAGSRLAQSFGSAEIAAALADRFRIPTAILLDVIDRWDGLASQFVVEHIDLDVAAAGTQIVHGGSKAPIIFMDLTASGGSQTLTATPTIEAGTFDGQILILRNDDATATLTFQDDPTIASDLQLNGGAAKALGTRDTMSLIWNATAAEWHQLTTLQAD